MRYFTVMTGLRGCYMPNDVYSIAVGTRRELKRFLLEQRDFVTDSTMTAKELRADGQYFPSDREVASAAAALWCRRATDRDSHLSTVIPYGPGGNCGIQVNPISREEYLEAQREGG